jgi:hypothetical protein
LAKGGGLVARQPEGSAVASVALIGSFKSHYEEVLRTLRAFTDHGIPVLTPKGTGIVRPVIPFVRFESDPADWPDTKVQAVTLHRIFKANAVYVVAPEGYVGRTTCYEIGRIVQAGRPLYFSHKPQDLPIFVPTKAVVSPEVLARMVLGDGPPLSPLHAGDSDEGPIPK